MHHFTPPPPPHRSQTDKFPVLPSETTDVSEIGPSVNKNTTAAPVFELFLTSSHHQREEEEERGGRTGVRAEARRLNAAFVPWRTRAFVSRPGCEVLMTQGDPGCEVTGRKASLAQAGRQAPGRLRRSGQHPEFRSAAYLGEDAYGTRSGLGCSGKHFRGGSENLWGFKKKTAFRGDWASGIC